MRDTRKLFESFRRFQEEEVPEDPNYIQTEYESSWVFRIAKGTGGNKTETLAEIRSVPNVTTVQKEGEIEETDTHYKGVFTIKFALKGENALRYVKTVLYPSLQKIEGLAIHSYKGYREVE